SPQLWFCIRAEARRDILFGTERKWTDKTILAGHSCVYEIFGEIDEPNSSEKKQILFNKISIISPSREWRKEVVDGMKCNNGRIVPAGLRFFAPLHCESNDITGMNHWVVERREDGAKRAAKEIARISPIIGKHGYNDPVDDGDKPYFYDFIAVGGSKSIEGHPVETRFTVKSILMKDGHLVPFDWQGGDRAGRQ
ncbi:MAG: hypothetical protein HY537_11975, partial [Deltaproteobacteria bacterium]|nr:hypothetical protein [Deltaproteobacteria bacterium]